MLVKSFYVGNMYGSQIDPLPCHYSASQQTSTSSKLSPSFLVENSCHQMPTHTYHSSDIYKASDIRFFHSCCADNMFSKHTKFTVLLPREHNLYLPHTLHVKQVIVLVTIFSKQSSCLLCQVDLNNNKAISSEKGQMGTNRIQN